MADVGISINIDQPGLYGQINIGKVSQPPQLIYAQPVVVVQDPQYVGAPIYLHVPPGHERHWSKHCAEYGACGRPVYFVRDDWYNREYVPRQVHRDDQGEDGDHRHGHGEGHGHKHDHDD
jgi:hypothetical protein